MSDPTRVYLVWVRFRTDGAECVAAAHAKRENAEEQVRRMTRHDWSDYGDELPSAADILGVRSVWIESIPVK